MQEDAHVPFKLIEVKKENFKGTFGNDIENATLKVFSISSHYMK